MHSRVAQLDCVVRNNKSIRHRREDGIQFYLISVCVAHISYWLPSFCFTDKIRHKIKSRCFQRKHPKVHPLCNCSYEVNQLHGVRSWRARNHAAVVQEWEIQRMFNLNKANWKTQSCGTKPTANLKILQETQQFVKVWIVCYLLRCARCCRCCRCWVSVEQEGKLCRPAVYCACCDYFVAILCYFGN